MKKLGLLLLAPLMLVGCNNASHDTGWVKIDYEKCTAFLVYVEGIYTEQFYFGNQDYQNFEYKHQCYRDYSELNIKWIPKNETDKKYNQISYVGSNITYILKSELY